MAIGSSINFSNTFGIIAFVLSIVVLVLAFIFIVPEKRRAKLNKFGKFLHDTVNFKYLIVEKILQAFYIFLTAFVLIFGFLMLFYVRRSFFGGSGEWCGYYGLLIMIFGPIIVRITYEFIMMFILIVKNVISINNKLQNNNSNDNNDDIFAGFNPNNSYQPADYSMPNYYPPQQNNSNPYGDTSALDNNAQKKYVYCPNCGSIVEEGTACAKCGTRV